MTEDIIDKVEIKKNTNSQVRICLIDDDENFREIYSVALKHEGFQVLTAGDGESGLALVKREYPDVILLDLQMPMLDGFEVLHSLSLDKSVSKIPVIILSNNDRETAFEKVGNFKAEFFLVKALTTPQEVINIIQEILSI